MVACFWIENMGIACERARLERLADQPVALAGEDDILRAVSCEAYACGIRVGQASVFARSLCQGLIVLPYDLEAYTDAAEAVWDIAALDSSIVEPVGPETVYAWMTGRDIARRVQDLADQMVGASMCDVRAGVGRSKLIARQAAHSRGAADGRVAVAGVGAREEVLLAAVPISSLTEIAPKVRARALRLGIPTLGDLIALAPVEVDRQFKEAGPLLRRLAAGEDGDPVRAVWPPKGVEHGVEFDDEARDEALLRQALALCAQKVAEGLGGLRVYCRALALCVRCEGGAGVGEIEPLASPTREALVLERAAGRLLGRLKIERPVTGLTLKASRLSAGLGAQLTLLSEEENGLTYEQREKLSATLTHLKGKYGIGAVSPGTLLNRAQRIHLWTYRLGQVRDEVVEVVMDSSGAPVRIYRAKRMRVPFCYEVTRIQNSWREADWSGGRLSEKICYRVLTNPDGLYELHHTGTNWHLCAVYD